MSYGTFAVYDAASGKIDRIIGCPEEYVARSCAPNEAVLPVTTETDTTHYVAGGALIPFPASPAPGYDWDWATKGWVGNLDASKALKWAAIKAARDAAEYGGFTFNGGTYDSDTVSVQRINGAVSMALIAQGAGQSFSIDWTRADNSVATLAGADVINLGMTLGQFVNGVHEKARQLRDQIDAATTVAAVGAIAW